MTSLNEKEGTFLGISGKKKKSEITGISFVIIPAYKKFGIRSYSQRVVPGRIIVNDIKGRSASLSTKMAL